MSERIETITPEGFAANIAAKVEELRATRKITEGFGGDKSYPEKALEESAARAKIENEIVESAVEALAVLGYEAVMDIITKNTGLRYAAHHDMSRLRGKMLKYVTEHFLQRRDAADSGSDAIRDEAGSQARAAADVSGQK